MPKELKDKYYYITLFKIAGHTTWRISVTGGSADFDRDWNSQKGGKKPKITSKKVLVIDCITGEIVTK